MQSEKESLIKFIKESLVKDSSIMVEESTLLFEDKILDSMNILDLLAYVETQLGRKLKDEEIIMGSFKDVNSIIRSFFDE